MLEKTTLVHDEVAVLTPLDVELTRKCEVAVLAGQTVGNLLDYSVTAKFALEDCAARMTKIEALQPKR